MLSHKKLKRNVHYDPLTGLFTRRISKSYKSKVGDIVGCKNKNGYVVFSINGKQYYAHILAWFYVHGYMPENDIDHRNRVNHDNWIANLRETSEQCNLRNTGNFSHNTSGVKGVCWLKQSKKWGARVQVNNRSKHIGVDEDFDEAVCLRLAAEQCLDWANCDSNSPAFQYVKQNIQAGNRKIQQR